MPQTETRAGSGGTMRASLIGGFLIKQTPTEQWLLLNMKLLTFGYITRFIASVKYYLPTNNLINYICSYKLRSMFSFIQKQHIFHVTFYVKISEFFFYQWNHYWFVETYILKIIKTQMYFYNKFSKVMQTTTYEVFWVLKKKHFLVSQF